MDFWTSDISLPALEMSLPFVLCFEKCCPAGTTSVAPPLWIIRPHTFRSCSISEPLQAQNKAQKDLRKALEDLRGCFGC